ncbi:MAG: 50S ribosomal protein L18 [Nanoarchaeota archaeon]
MKIHKAYTLKYRRKREGKTDYKSRLGLLASRRLRIVVRRTLSNIHVQVVEYSPTGDKTLISVDSRELLKYGWKGHRGNTTSSYLTGMLCGLKAKKKGIKEGILDLGLNRAIKGSSLFAAVKGLKLSIEVPCNEDYFPNEERIKGQHLKKGNYDEVRKKILEKWQ